MKKFLASLLAVAMMFTMVTPAMATEAVPQAPTETGYDGKALPAAPLVNGDTITVTPDNAQYTLDGAYGSINGETIHFSAGVYKDVLVLNRPTKYAGSETQYFNAQKEKTENPSDLNEKGTCYYARTVQNVTFTADEGATLNGFLASSGHVYSANTDKAYDYVREHEIVNTNNSYQGYCSLKNVSFEGLTLNGMVKAEDYLSTLDMSNGETIASINDGIHFTNCTFKGDNNKMAESGFAAVKFNADTEYFSNVTVENCTITNYYQGVYVQGVDGLAVRNNVIDNTTHNAIAVQNGGKEAGPKNPVKGDVLIQENVIKNAKDRAIRFGEANTADSITINNNFMINSGDDKDELIKAQSIPTDDSVMNLDNNYWNGKDAAEVVKTFTPPTKVGVTSGKFGCDVKPYLPADLTQDENGNVVALTESNAVAQVGDKYYKDFYDAVEAAKNGGTVKLLQNTTVDTWNQVWNAKDLTIDGNGKNLTVGKVESNGNGDFLFYGAENLNVSDLNVVFNGKGNGFDMKSGSLTNVTMTGHDKSVNKIAVFVGAGDGKVSINGCTFKNFGMGVYSQPTGQPTAAIAVDNSTFDNCDYPLVSYAADTAFTDNNVQNSGEISFAAAADSANNDKEIKYTVTGNILQDAGKVWFYGGDLNKVDFEQNKVLGNTKVDTTDAKADTTLDVSNNYWGGQAPSENQLVGGSDVIKGDDVYYEKDTMKPEDLNTYQPSTGGGTVVKRYDVTLADTDNGTITATHKRASKNSTVTITTTPDEGYVVDAVTVTEKDGDKVEVTKKDDNKYTFKMPASDVTVKATFKVAPTEPEQPSGLPFTDVAKDAWYFPAVEYVFNNGLMNGTTATTFAPNVNLNRAMMAAVLYNMEGGPACDKSGLFSDVENGKWYTDAVNWAASNNIVSGMPDGTYAPNQALTREQMASVLYRYAEYKGIDVSARADLSTFTDGTTVSPWAQDVVQWAVAEKLMSGNGNELQPKGTASRAQVATVLMNYCENVAK